MQETNEEHIGWGRILMVRKIQKAGTQEAEWKQMSIKRMSRKKPMGTSHASCLSSDWCWEERSLFLHGFPVKVKDMGPRSMLLTHREECRNKEGRGIVVWYSNILRNRRRLPKECGARGSILKTWGQPSPGLVSDSSKEFPFLDCKIPKYGSVAFPRRTSLMQPSEERAINSLICFLPGQGQAKVGC